MNIIFHQLHLIWHEHFERKPIFKQIHRNILHPIYIVVKYSEIYRWKIVDWMAYPTGGLYSLRVSPNGRYHASISEDNREIVFIINTSGKHVYRHPSDKAKEETITKRFAEKIRAKAAL